MRHLVRTLAAVLVVPILAVQGIAAETPTVDSLLAKTLEAKGGAAKLKAVSSIRMTGRLSVQGMEFDITVTTKRPNLMLQEMSMQGQRIVSAFDGERVWTINPFMGSSAPQEMQGIQADVVRDQSTFDGPLVGWRERGDSMEVLGEETVEGARTWKLKLTRRNGRVMHIFLDADTGLERKWSAIVEQNGLQSSIDTVMTDYRAVEGLMVARSMTTYVSGQQQASITIEKVEINPAVDDAAFEMPQ